MHTVIYHNPNCSKSKQTLTLLNDQGLDPEVRLYLTQPPAIDELQNIITLLGVSVRDIIRNHETPYSELNLDDDSLSETQLLQAIHENPILLQRPIVIVDNEKAAIGRPPENILAIL